MIAALPWYDFPCTRLYLDAVWRETRSLLTTEGIDQVPAALNHTDPYHQLNSRPNLILSQCCGLDLFQPQTANVVPFAAPVITAFDVPPGKYFSYIVARPAANLHCPTVVINNRFSHSGHTVMKIWLQAHERSNYTIVESGSHAQSLTTLRDGRADIAAIDAFSWHHLDTSKLHILDTSESVTAPPFITGRQSMVPILQLTAALGEAFERCGKQFGVGGIVPVSIGDYRELANAAAAFGVL